MTVFPLELAIGARGQKNYSLLDYQKVEKVLRYV